MKKFVVFLKVGGRHTIKAEQYSFGHVGGQVILEKTDDNGEMVRVATYDRDSVVAVVDGVFLQ